jgi:hypothetical protein
MKPNAILEVKDRNPQFAILTLNGLQLTTYDTAGEFRAAEIRLAKRRTPFTTFTKGKNWIPNNEYSLYEVTVDKTKLAVPQHRATAEVIDVAECPLFMGY